MSLTHHSRTARLSNRLAAAAIAAVTLLLGVAPATGAGRSGTVYLTTYLRGGPGDQFAALDELKPHSQLEVVSCEGAWCRVVSRHVTGYVAAASLNAPDIHALPPASGQDVGCVIARLNGAPRSGDDVRVCRR